MLKNYSNDVREFFFFNRERQREREREGEEEDDRVVLQIPIFFCVVHCTIFYDIVFCFLKIALERYTYLRLCAMGLVRYFMICWGCFRVRAN